MYNKKLNKWCVMFFVCTINTAFASANFASQITIINNSHCTMTQLSQNTYDRLQTLSAPSLIGLNQSHIVDFTTKSLSVLDVFSGFFTIRYDVACASSRNELVIQANYLDWKASFNKDYFFGARLVHSSPYSSYSRAQVTSSYEYHNQIELRDDTIEQRGQEDQIAALHAVANSNNRIANSNYSVANSNRYLGKGSSPYFVPIASVTPSYNIYDYSIPVVDATPIVNTVPIYDSYDDSIPVADAVPIVDVTPLY